MPTAESLPWAWGLLPIVVPLFAYVAFRLGVLAFPDDKAKTSDRAVAAVILAFASVVLSVSTLSLLHAVTRGALVSLLVVTACVAGVWKRRVRFTWPSLAASPSFVLPCAVGLVALLILTLAARWLPVWQWDALGYHLPFVHFTLQARSMSGVPRELEYIGSYPHDVEMFFVALRACLPDDRLIDLGQIPFGLGGAIVTAALARRMGASRDSAIAAGVSWILVPAVFLQLPTNYVDVGAATFLLSAIYFVLAPPSLIGSVLGGIALGLFVGSKPSAPLPAALLYGVLALRAVRAGSSRGALLAGVSLLAFGGSAYAENLATHHNPIWPVAIDLGPLHLPGNHPLRELLAAGANAPRLHGPLPLRMLRSLLALSAPPVFDMRVGGFGPLVLAALPFGLGWIARQKSPTLWLVIVASLASPDPAVARYVLAFPALVLAAAAPSLVTLAAGKRTRLVLGAAVALVGAAELAYAVPGLTGEGPPLLSYASLPDGVRALAVGADGPPLAIAEARALVGPGETFAFDENMDLSDLSWDLSQSYDVVFLPRDLRGEELGSLLERQRVRVLATGDGAPAGLWALSHPLQYRRVSALPSCRTGTCALFVRR